MRSSRGDSSPREVDDRMLSLCCTNCQHSHISSSRALTFIRPRHHGHSAHGSTDALLSQATEYLQRVLARDPEDKQAWEELGQCYLETGNLENSLEAYRRAVALQNAGAGGASGK